MFKDRNFSGEHLILILYVLTGIVEEENTIDISQSQVMVLFPHLLNGNAGDQYRAAPNASCSGNVWGILQWPGDVQHVLRTLAIDQAITEAVNDFDDIRQNENEKGTPYVARINKVAYLCVKVHRDD